jgi:predicted RNA-binding Zn-ribbon protein involved in translation (DUF1610 family)
MTATTNGTMGYETFQNHERRHCPGCNKRIMRSTNARRYANGEVRCTECPAPVAAPVVVAAPAPVASARTNRYAARCACCGREVPANSGVLASTFNDDTERTVWTVRHADATVCARWLADDRADARTIHAHDVATRTND